MIKVFIDGKEGTTGLRLAERLSSRSDVELISIPEEERKDPRARAERINASDITFLCLPDAAAIESVSLVKNDRVRIIDASTTHRSRSDWTYGLPELGIRSCIKASKRVTVPGCHAGGFVTLVYPLIMAGILPEEAQLSVFSLTGYSGGGKKMIAEYESADRSPLLKAPRIYGLTQQHKHLREMAFRCVLKTPPVFSPIVCDFYSGMEVTVPLFASQLTKLRSADALRDFYADFYAENRLIGVMPAGEPTDGFLPATAMSGRDDLRICVCGNDERITVSALFDNLGKGASGAALQCMNIMIGADECEGLVWGKERR